jgi:hypothetical protein
MFVSVGFDDNGFSGLPGSGGEGGIAWVMELFQSIENPDGTDARASFFLTSNYLDPENSDESELVAKAWRALKDAGHELGNHTRDHAHGLKFTPLEWHEQMEACEKDMEAAGVDTFGVTGFRTPFLEYNDATFEALKAAGLSYDCSIEDGYQPDHDGTNYLWPYTLDEGSPGHQVQVEWGMREKISVHPGVWEMPAHPVIVPPDPECKRYGVEPGLRDRMKAVNNYFDVDSGKITGFDYNLWILFAMTGDEVLATLKHTLDLRLAGNRAPFMLGAHSDIYSSKYSEEAPNATLPERQETLRSFLEYALTKPEVRIVPIKDILDWVRDPQPLP